ncbi:MAG: VOC family protein [Candidatus Binatia bacterium]
MSRLFGEMRQIAFVVRDLNQALRYWTETLGVGPFFLLRDFIPVDYRYGGEPAPAPHLTIALGFSGEFQVELIQQHDDNPSAYRDFLLSGREGFQHVSSWVTRMEYDQTMEAARTRRCDSST